MAALGACIPAASLGRLRCFDTVTILACLVSLFSFSIMLSGNKYHMWREYVCV